VSGQAWYNPLMRWLLASPLHGLVSGNTLVLTVTGQKTRRSYSFPVNYLRQGDRLLVFSQQDRTWWRNLRGGAPVTVRLQRDDCRAWGQVLAAAPGEIEAALRLAFPRLGAERIVAMAASMVLIEVRLNAQPAPAAHQES
jgi:hypothetical protein